MTSPATIDRYLDELADLLTGPGGRARAFLLEVEAHLSDERDARVARGEHPAAAESAAIAGFGSPIEVARAENHVTWRASRGGVAAAVAVLALELATVGMVVVGIAGAIARIIASFGLATAMYGPPHDVVMPAVSCAHWLAVQPTAVTCVQAGTLEAADDLTMISVAIGFIGLLVAVPLAVRRLRRRVRREALPPTLGPAVSATMFGAAAIGLAALGLTNAVISTTWGRGMWLTDAACAAVACAGSVVLLLRALRRSSESPSLGIAS